MTQAADKLIALARSIMEEEHKVKGRLSQKWCELNDMLEDGDFTVIGIRAMYEGKDLSYVLPPKEDVRLDPHSPSLNQYVWYVLEELAERTML